jgi:hypothetical protein
MKNIGLSPNFNLQVKITILNWTCLLIPPKYMENQEQSGQVQFRTVIFTCIQKSLKLSSFLGNLRSLKNLKKLKKAQNPQKF